MRISKKFFLKCKNNVDKILNQGMIFLDKVNHDHLVEIYKQVPKSNFFYSIFGDKKLNNVVSYLLTGKKSGDLDSNDIHYMLQRRSITLDKLE